MNYTSTNLKHDVWEVNSELAAHGCLGRFVLLYNFCIELHRDGGAMQRRTLGTAREARVELYEMAFYEALNGPRVTLDGGLE